jgi:hypothetical protein
VASDPTNAGAGEILPSTGNVLREQLRDVMKNGCCLPGLKSGTVGFNEAEPESEERIGNTIERPLAVTLRGCEGNLTSHQTQLEQPLERSRQ